MRKTIIDKLCAAINEAHRLTYPMKGYRYFADIKGDGRGVRRVYIITGDNGGVTAINNGATYRQTAANLREVLEASKVY